MKLAVHLLVCHEDDVGKQYSTQAKRQYSFRLMTSKVRFKMRETYCKICNDLVSLPAIADFPLENPSVIKKLNF